MRRTRLRPVSARRSKELREYSKLRKSYLETHPYCEICIGEKKEKTQAEDIHHRQGRQHSKLNDSSLWLAVCRDCHNTIHNNPKWAYEKGYLLYR